jgi:O-antigen/teichoic acid export membrane protein
VFTFPIFALTVPLAPATTVTLFGERYAGAATVLAILATGYYVNASLGFNVYTLQVCGRIRHLVGVNVLAASLNLVLCFLLAPGFGAVGVAAANCTAMVGQNLVNQWALRRSIATSFVDRESRPCYALILLGAGALWAFQLLVSPGIVLSVVAAGVVSLGVIAASQKSLRLAETFPELQRVPVVGKLVR